MEKCTNHLTTDGERRDPWGKINLMDKRSWIHYMHVHVKSDQNEQNNKKRHIVKLYHTKGLHGFTFHRTVNCLKEIKKERGMSGLNFSTSHEELITSNFKTSLSGVCFQFGIFMTLNLFYIKLAGFSPFIIHGIKIAISFPIIQHWGPHDLIGKGGCCKKPSPSIRPQQGSVRGLPFIICTSLAKEGGVDTSSPQHWLCCLSGKAILEQAPCNGVIHWWSSATPSMLIYMYVLQKEIDFIS